MRTRRVGELIRVHGQTTSPVVQIKVLRELLITKFLPPSADQGIRSRIIFQGEQVVILDVVEDNFSILFVIGKGVLWRNGFSVVAANVFVEVQCFVRLREGIRPPSR